MSGTGAPAPSTAVSIRNLARRFGGVPVLRGIDLDVGRGSCVAVFGPNGAGKSTLLRVLGGLLRADSGSVRVLDSELPGGAALRRRIGFLGHESFLYRDLDARENLQFYARLFGVRDTERCERLLAEVGLEPFATRRTGSFSRGMLQRLGLARAALHEPELLLLDEPLTGLDPDGAAVLARLIARLRATGTTVMMTTHDTARALESASRAIILQRGCLAWDSADALPASAAEMAALYAQVVAQP